MMSPVSAPSDSNGRPRDAPETASVLANLPRTRPQRSTARRTAARAATVKSMPTRKATKKPRTRSTKSTAPSPEAVPMQGFESEHDRARGPVHPPGGAELITSAAEVFGELAKSGLSAGERLLKDVLSRLPLS